MYVNIGANNGSEKLMNEKINTAASGKLCCTPIYAVIAWAEITVPFFILFEDCHNLLRPCHGSGI
jgi:hypothetical protein